MSFLSSSTSFEEKVKGMKVDQTTDHFLLLLIQLKEELTMMMAEPASAISNSKQQNYQVPKAYLAWAK